MSLATASPTLFFDQDDLQTLIEDLSQAVRCDPHLAPVMHQIVGNQWQALERGVLDLLVASLSGQMVPSLSAKRLNRALAVLSHNDCERLHAMFLEAVLARFPLLDAGNFTGVADGVLAWISPLLEETDLRQRQRRFLEGLQDWQRSVF